ncbi:uncharacterized protein LOC117145664 isoform X1 [Drosophila mauritiana]|uniref:Uncharacterized protein LOC117145664 isoform X1 n=1 Tax=Drosophila mauritiana TaxID=7226 RepID=A0A6P8KVR5_DROMA|nr:uncharacterized protein LOC117145664 isoform X1 [Drosophila mauritiana]
MQRRTKITADTKRIQSLKALFKKVVRIMSLNDPWRENEGDPRITSNVMRNLSTRVRTKSKSGFLTAADKSLIRTPHVIRTIAERRKLCQLFAKLTCLAGFSPKIRARLVPVVRLMPVDAGRIIIRQSDAPITVFFVLTGEVHMIKNQKNQKGEGGIVGFLGAGDMMGDVELLQGIKRTHTFRAATYCELLVLYDYDFAPILGAYMTKIWDEKKRALKALDYFDFLDDDQIVEACRYGRLKQFDPLDTIFCEDIGSMTNVHFVLSGECLILQCLNIKVSMKRGKKVYDLLPAAEGDVSKMFRKAVRSTFSSQSTHEDQSKIDILDLVASTSSSSTGEKSALNRKMRKMDLRDIEKRCGMIKSPPQKSRFTWRRSIRKSTMSVFSRSENRLISEDVFENFWEMCEDESDIESYSSGSDYTDMEFKQSFRFGPALSNITEIDYDGSSIFSSSLPSFTSSSGSSTTPTIESHFIDVGTITFGGIFGLGEKMENRVIMARSTVQCLILPRFFLLEKKQNPGNVWERRLLYVGVMVPSREALFAHYRKACDWKKFKNDIISETLKPSDNDNTNIEDVPIICRIVESPEDLN